MASVEGVTVVLVQLVVVVVVEVLTITENHSCVDESG